MCKGIFTGKKCEIPDPCLALVCQNGGECDKMGGRAICVCNGEWFGATCSVPKPKSKIMLY